MKVIAARMSGGKGVCEQFVKASYSAHSCGYNDTFFKFPSLDEVHMM